MRLLLIGILLAVFASSASPSPAAFPVVGGEEEAVAWNEVAATEDDDRKGAVADALRNNGDMQLNPLLVTTGLSIGTLNQTLFELEMMGIVKPYAGGTYHLLT